MTDFERRSGAGSSTGATGAMTERPHWPDYSDRFRSDWESRYGTNKPWGEHEEGFRYGWEAGFDDRFKGREFRDVESDLERDWPNRYQRWGQDYQRGKQGAFERGWNDFKDTVREGFDRAKMEFSKRF